MEFGIYLFAKTLAYTGWTYVGLRYFRGDKFGTLLSALALGPSRVASGLLMGGVTFYFLAALEIEPPKFGSESFQNFFFLTIYFAPARTMLWLLGAKIVGKSVNSQTIQWSAGGMLMSSSFDLYACRHLGDWLFIG